MEMKKEPAQRPCCQLQQSLLRLKQIRVRRATSKKK